MCGPSGDTQCEDGSSSSRVSARATARHACHSLVPGPVVFTASVGLQTINTMARLQHELPPAASSRCWAKLSRCGELVVIVVLNDPSGQASAPLPPSCPGCSGRLSAWGYARTRQVRQRGGHRVLVRPRRVRCGSCRVTHVLLPACAGAPRRADAIEVIGAALLAKARGRGHRRIAADLGLPAATVRGWIRRATERAEDIRADATGLARQLDPALDTPPPTGSRLTDALEALGAAVAAAIRRLGPIAAPWPLAATITRGLLHPARDTRGARGG